MMHLKHRNIVEMCDFYTSNNQLCIVMDYADGGDLRREIVKARTSKVAYSCLALAFLDDEAALFLIRGFCFPVRKQVPIPEDMITIWMIQV
jgi:serine/threonine protein kinase